MKVENGIHIQWLCSTSGTFGGIEYLEESKMRGHVKCVIYECGLQWLIKVDVEIYQQKWMSNGYCEYHVR